MIGKSVGSSITVYGLLITYCDPDEKKADDKQDEKIVGELHTLILPYLGSYVVLVALDDSDIQILKTYVSSA